MVQDHGFTGGVHGVHAGPRIYHLEGAPGVATSGADTQPRGELPDHELCEAIEVSTS